MLKAAAAAAFLFCSGFCALTYQVAWTRELRVVFGASTPATAAAMAIFMGGLLTGSLVFARRAGRASKPLKLYAELELGIAFLAAMSPVLLAGAGRIWSALGGSLALSGPAAALVRLVLSALAIGGAAVLMGGTLPAMARAGGLDRGDRKYVALLYGANTLGAFVGAFTSTFSLIELAGVKETVWIAAGLNGVVALAARVIAEGGKEVAAEASREQRGMRRILFASFLTGFAFFLMEIVWYRLSAPLLGGTTYSYGLILVLALFGVGAGGLLHGFVGPARPMPASFAVTCALEATLLLAPFALGDHLAMFAFYLHAWGQPSFLGHLVSWSLVGGLLVLPAAFVAGWQFPLLLSIAGDDVEGVAFDTGRVYAANTLGAIAGSLAGGFGLLPLVGAGGAFRLAALALVVAAVPFVVRGDRRRNAATLLFAACAFALAYAPSPSAVWRHGGIGGGRAQLFSSTKNDRERVVRDVRRFFVEELDGVESTVGVNLANGLAFMVNGKSDGETTTDAVTMVGTGVLPAILHGHVQKAFVIGLGTGQTAGWLADAPGMASVDVVEIEPEVVHFAKQCFQTNRNALANPKVHVHVGDGREALTSAREQYDLIVSEPSNPYRAGVASFYSVDLYRAAKEKLAPHGLFAQWVQSYEIEPAAFRIVLSTMSQVFPSVSVWRLAGNDVLLVAGDEPLDLDAKRIASDLEKPPYSDVMLHVFRGQGVEALLARHVADDAVVRRVAEGAPVSTDDEPLFEFSIAMSVGRHVAPPLDQLAQIAAKLGGELPEVNGSIDLARLAAYRARFDNGTEQAWRDGRVDALVLNPTTTTLDPLGRLMQSFVDSTKDSPDHHAAGVAARAQLTADGLGPEAAWVAFSEAVTDGPAEAVEVTGRDAFREARREPWLSVVLVETVAERLEAAPLTSKTAEQLLDDVVAAPFAGFLAERTRASLAMFLARRAAEHTIPPKECVAAFAIARNDPYWDEPNLTARAACYDAHAPDRAAAAHADLDRFRKNSAPPLDALMTKR
jgi:predicted membrane-bound spermidine synthase